MDLTDVGFRKANWGVFDSSTLFTTDEGDIDGMPLYYLADGSYDWVEMFHGGDGCFGDAQDSDVFGFKGYFAFPVADFWIRDNTNWNALDAGTPANMADVQGVYLFWDYSDMLMGGEKFTIDNIEFVDDYKAPLPVPAVEVEEEVVEAAPAEAAPRSSGRGSSQQRQSSGCRSSSGKIRSRRADRRHRFHRNGSSRSYSRRSRYYQKHR